MSDLVTVVIELEPQTKALRLTAPPDALLVLGMLEMAKRIVHRGLEGRPSHASGLAVVGGAAAQAIARDARVLR